VTPGPAGYWQSLALTVILGLAMCCNALRSRADERPLWEFGLGAGTVVFPEFRGADTSHIYPVPVPYLIYRGEFLKSDRNGLRELLFDSSRLELNVSVNATTPVRSRNSDVRAGMPDLKPTVEVGPSLDAHLWRTADERVRLDFQLPARRVVTIENDPHAAGWFIGPRLNLDIRDVGGNTGMDTGLLVSPLFADRAYHDYFYTVAPQFATSSRPAYQAAGGYSGTELLWAASKRFPTYWVGAFVRYDTLAGATFLPSPLVRRHEYWAGGVGIAWMLGKSSRLVEALDEP
jgi:outer membrane scaffolding protein for murein synthesis (MipA/OmpV family)